MTALGNSFYGKADPVFHAYDATAASLVVTCFVFLLVGIRLSVLSISRTGRCFLGIVDGWVRSCDAKD